MNIKFFSIFYLCKQAFPCLFMAIVPTIIAAQLMGDHVESVYIRFFSLTSISAIGWLFGLGLSNHPFYEEIKIIFRKITPSRKSTCN